MIDKKMSQGFVRVLNLFVPTPNMFGVKASELHISISTIIRVQVFHNDPSIDKYMANNPEFMFKYPILVVTNERGVDYVVYPTEEERNKLLRSKPILEDILDELRYNPDAGSRVAEARERFNDGVMK